MGAGKEESNVEETSDGESESVLTAGALLGKSHSIWESCSVQKNCSLLEKRM